MSSNEEEHGIELADLDARLKELRGSLDRLTKLHENAAVVVPDGERVDRLIDDVSKNLAAIREANGLPPKHADEFAEEIRLRADRRLASSAPTVAAGE